MDWPRAINLFRTHLKLERSLSDRTVEAYLSDLAKLRTYAESHSPALAADALRLEDLQAFLEDVDAGEPLGGPGLAVDLERTLLGERAGALVVEHLLEQPLEDRVDELAEAEREARLGLALLDVVQAVAKRALLEATESRVREMGVAERFRGHERFSGRSGRSWLGVFSNATTCEPGNTESTRITVAACSGVISLRGLPVYAGTSHSSP